MMRCGSQPVLSMQAVGVAVVEVQLCIWSSCAGDGSFKQRLLGRPEILPVVDGRHPEGQGDF